MPINEERSDLENMQLKARVLRELINIAREELDRLHDRAMELDEHLLDRIYGQ